MTNHSFCPGIITLLSSNKHLLRNKRIGLVSHPAAVDSTGTSSVDLIVGSRGLKLSALFGPEHGFFGTAGAGETVVRTKHPFRGIPVYSLYGKHRKPDAQMLRNLDVIVFDLQDIGARPYTYVSTLRLVLEAAAEQGRPVIVADRPIPLPCVADGPVLDPHFESFVASVHTPMSYGMTPGEAALWLRKSLNLDVDLTVSKMKGYNRQPARGPDWPPWIPPSPGIASWESAYCYTATVCFEALPAVDHGRGTGLPFQVFGAPWMKSLDICERLSALRLPGARFHPHRYLGRSQTTSGQAINGARITVTDPDIFRPVRTGISIVSCLQDIYGLKRIWRAPGTRLDFFDKLFGTNTVREALMDRERPGVIAGRWKRDLLRFNKSRRTCLLYPSK
jgi:uncharacterized protein YbbC (DUF1343 family)